MKLLLAGDSLVHESRDFFNFFGTSAGHQTKVLSWGGTAPCDWFTEIDRAAHDWKFDRIAVAFSGNALTPGMYDAMGTVEALKWKYQRDLDIICKIAYPKKVLLVVAPRPMNPQRDSQASAVIDAIVEVQKQNSQHTKWCCGGELITPNYEYTPTMPRMASEPAGPPDVQVRSPDGLHFCPGGYGPDGSCSVWSSGAWRYATTILKHLINDF